MAKVLLINNCYPTKSYPNRSTYIKTIEDRMIQAGIDVDRLVLKSDYSSTFQKLVSYFNFYKELLTYPKYGEFDYIYIHHFPFSVLPLIPHLPYFKNTVINWHGEDLLPISKIAKVLCFLSYRFLKSNFIHLVPSVYFKELLIKKLDVKPESTIVSPSGGVDTELFSPIEVEKREGGINIGFASGLRKGKGIEYLLYILEQRESLPKIFLHIINYGNDKEEYLTKLPNNENIIFHKVYEKDKMPLFYNKIDILAFPTSRSSESLGLVALEAMSCGVPVVGPSHFALKSIIKNGVNGESYENFSYSDFLNALIRCIHHLGNYSPRETAVDQYSKEHVIQQLREIFV